MIEFNFVWLALTLGVTSFFAPCAVALLPGYVATLIARPASKKKQSITQILFRSLYLGLFSVLGVVVVYGLFSVLWFTITAFIKPALPYIVIVMGVGIFILGIAMIRGKMPTLHFKTPSLKGKAEYVESFLFGITFGLGALGCLFPLFLTILAIPAESVVANAVYVSMFMLGMALLLIAVFILSGLSRKWLQKVIFKILPYINTVGGIIVMAAAVYIIWYQWALI